MDGSVILGTAGHIDHGKTALVRALTGVDTDRLPEEKRRGITIDLGFAPLAIDGLGTLGIVDVPGHEGFVRTMLAGATGIDLALLVVAADEGVMPQTREHLEILSLLGIRHGVVALTKSDLVDEEWLALARQDVAGLLSGTSLESAPIVAVSATTGTGLGALRDAIAAMVADARQSGMNEVGIFRMPVDRAFSVKGTGTVVTGTIWSGAVGRDRALFIQPGGRAVRVRGIQSHGKVVERAMEGHRAAIALSGCDISDVERGRTLVDHAGWEPTREIIAMVKITNRAVEPTARTEFLFHHGTAETTARISRLRGSRDGTPFLARVSLDEALVIGGGDRFILRLPSPARTVGGGLVVDSHPRGRGRELARELAQSGVALDDSGRALGIVRSTGVGGVARDELAIRAGIGPRRIDDLVRSGSIIEAGRLFDADCVSSLAGKIDAAVTREMGNHQLAQGVSLQTIRATMKAPQSVIDVAIGRLIDEGRIERVESLVRPKEWSSQLDEEQRSLSAAILHEICVRPSEPPSVAELSERFGSTTVAMLRRLEQGGEIDRVEQDRYYSSAAVKAMLERMRMTLEPGRAYTPAELREILGVTRKYLIPFLEFCDRRGVTERTGNGRKVRLDTGRAASKVSASERA